MCNIRAISGKTKQILKTNIRYILVYVFLILFPILFFMPIMLTDVSINIGDGIGYEILIDFFRRVVLSGEFPLWNKYVALGTSFVGDIQNKVFYPITWACALLFPEQLCFKIFFVTHICLANVLMYKFCREILCDDAVSIFGAFLFSFSNLIIIRYEHINILCSLVWIPGILIYVIKYFRIKKFKFLLIAAVLMGMQFMAGFPQTAFYSDIFIFTTMLFLNFYYGYRLKNYFVDIVRLVAMYLGICMVQILPLIEIMQFSRRNNISFEYFSDGAANLWLLLNLFSPIATGNFGSLLSGTYEFPTDMYLGVIPLTLILFAIVFLLKNRNISFLFIYSIGALIFSSACNNIPFLGKIIYSLPLIGSFRTTTRMLAFFVIPWLIISIITLKTIIIENKWDQYLKIVFGLLISLLLIFIPIKLFCAESKNKVLWFLSNYNVGLKSIILLGMIVLFILVWKYVLNYKYRPYIFSAIIVFFQIFDVYFFNIDPSSNSWRIQNLTEAKTYRDVFGADIKDILYEEDTGKERYFIEFQTWDDLANTSWAIRPNGNMLTQLPMIQSYITFNNPSLLELMNTTYGMMMNVNELEAVENQSLMNSLNIGYIVLKTSHQPLGKYENRDVLYEEYKGRNLRYIEEISLGFCPERTLISISIDAIVSEDGGEIYIYDGEQKIEYLGNLDENIEFYCYDYTLSQNISNLKIVIENSENTVLKGFRVEKYEISELTTLNRIYEDSEYVLYRNTENVGHMFVFKNVIPIENSGDFVVAEKQTINFVENAYIDSKYESYSMENGGGSISNIRETNNSITAEVYIESEQALVGFSESFYPGWKAYIDGKKTEIIAVNDLIQGIFVPQGEHKILFVYEPLSLLIGLLISIVTFLIMILVLYRKRGI